MRTEDNLRLFDKGTATEIRLFFLVLMTVALIVVDVFHLSAPIRTGLSQVIAPLRSFVLLPKEGFDKVSVWSEAVSNAYHENTDYLQKKIQISKLETANELLTNQNEELKRLLGLKQMISYPSLPVEVMYRSPNQKRDVLVINRGQADGIKVGMPVIDQGGVVGQVHLVTRHSAEVLLISNRRMSVPVLNVRNSFRTIVFGGAESSDMEIRYVIGDQDVKVGDRLITSGIGHVYPEGLSLGVVESVQKNSEQGYAKILVKASSKPYYFKHFLVLMVTRPEGEGSRAEKEVNDE